MAVEDVSPETARDLQARGAALVDVRSSAEYDAGHPAGAVNVPLLERDEDTGMMMPNPDFIRVMQANFPADATLVLSCQAGGRSARAARMLESFGYGDVKNMLGGFKGKHDPVDGRAIEPGWHASGLPVDTDAPAGATYADLTAKADAGS